MSLRGPGFVQMKEEVSMEGLDAEIWTAISSTHKRMRVLYEKVALKNSSSKSLKGPKMLQSLK